MRYIIKPKMKYTQGYCLTCSTQCNVLALNLK
ncbi:Clo7bot family Cys-rich peptide [Tepidibacter hydrothermalis]|uniref:Clo7bot family Cys-rich peptide n=1 Tax=Tepidibacter hydrothermalis TaxID=3036126 RepID=A0ABY8EGY9_9FIRM|nr:Clo7bot family Cys-rich peptide [Tepidibacter hydrothermalis]WFD10767.1 Clo7bot family Cys-rich peptide [Tepidibacter hydrothermalis]